jgi:hypothetical protein
MDILSITDKYENTHMPFIASNEAGDELLLFTIMLNGAWKIHYCLNNSPVAKLHTGLLDEINECSPVAWYIDGEWVISFVAGAHITHKRLKLYQMRLTDKQPTAIGVSKTGFILSDNYTCAVGTTSSFSYPGRHVATAYYIKNSAEMLCVRPFDGSLDKLHISFKAVDGNIYTVIYDISSKATTMIATESGLPLYKGCFYKGSHYYALQLGENFEDRKIVSTDKIISKEAEAALSVSVHDYMSRSLLDSRLTNNDMLNMLPEEFR